MPNVDERQWEELSKLLRMADELQEHCDYYERRVFMYWTVLVVVVGAIILGAAVYYVAGGGDPGQRGVLAILGGTAYSGSIIVSMVAATRRMSKRRRKDQRALESLVSMLRELERTLLAREDVSMIEKAEFRIRLSRFDIPPSRMPDASYTGN